MLCRSCHCQLTRGAPLCDRCGTPVPGASPPLELVLPDERRIALTGHLDAGRADGCAIVVDDPSVSRRHAMFVVDGPLATIEDLGSSHGTWVRGRRIAGRRAARRRHAHPARRQRAADRTTAEHECRRTHADRSDRGDRPAAGHGRQLARAASAPALGLRPEAPRGGRGERALRAVGHARRRVRAPRRGRGEAARAARRALRAARAGGRGRAPAGTGRTGPAGAPGRRPGCPRHARRRRCRDRRDDQTPRLAAAGDAAAHRSALGAGPGRPHLPTGRLDPLHARRVRARDDRGQRRAGRVRVPRRRPLRHALRGRPARRARRRGLRGRPLLRRRAARARPRPHHRVVRAARALGRA